MRRMTAMAMCVLLLGAGGCASKFGTPQTTANYYPACYRPIAELRQNENSVTQGTAAGAFIGALGGALVGLLSSGGKWQGAVMGGVTGGVGGTMVGHAYSKKQKEADENRRMAYYMQELEGDISNLDITTASARAALQCYDRQFNVLLETIRGGQIDRRTAAARYAEIITGREEAIAILGNAVQYSRDLEQQYGEAFTREEPEIADLPPQTTTPKKAPPAKKGGAQKSKRKRTLTQKTDQLEKDWESAQTTTMEQTRAINEAMATLQDIRA